MTNSAARKWWVWETTHLDRGAQSLQSLLFARIVFLYLVAAVVVLQQLVISATAGDLSFALGYGLLALGFFVSLLNSLFLDRIKNHWLVPLGNIVFDSLIISVWLLFYAEGGSFYPLVYLIQILVVSLVFYQRAGTFAALVSGLCFAFVSASRPVEASFWSWVVYMVLFVAIGFIGGYLSQELQRTTLRLREKQDEVATLKAFQVELLRSMPTGLMAVDNNMQVTYMNSAAADILETQPTHVMNRQLEEVAPGLKPFFTSIETTPVDDVETKFEDRRHTSLWSTGDPAHPSYYVDADSEGGKARLQQIVELNSEGENPQVIRGDVAPLSHQLMGTGIKSGRVLLFQDITKLSRMEVKLKEHEKLAAVGQLAAGIAHEIRNPLAGISGSIEMLKGSSTGLDGEEKALMEIALREIDRLNDLISEFLDYVKPESPALTAVDMKSVIAEILQTFENGGLYSKVIVFEPQLREGVLALAHEKKIRQVVWNLLNNAAQAMDGHQGSVRIGCETQEHKVVFWVEDEGCGMNENVLSHLYEPFFTTKERGTGLGLATVYKIVDAHQGEIRVRSRPGKGTRFEVVLNSA